MVQRSTPGNSVKVLSDDEVREIESRPWAYPPHDEWLESPLESRHVILTVAERDALCATVRALRQSLREANDAGGDLLDTNTVLREQLARCEGSRRVHELDNHHNALACGYCAGPIKEEITRLQSRLAQVTQERDDVRNENERLRESGKRIADELGHQDSYWDDPLRGNFKV